MFQVFVTDRAGTYALFLNPRRLKTALRCAQIVEYYLGHMAVVVKVRS